MSAAAGKDRIFFAPIAMGSAGTKYFVGLGAIALQGVPHTLYVRAAGYDPALPHQAWEVMAADALSASPR
ncbi:MAG: hypothetical protein U0572_16350 [Phycisphaerales bacterium]